MPQVPAGLPGMAGARPLAYPAPDPAPAMPRAPLPEVALANHEALVPGLQRRELLATKLELQNRRRDAAHDLRRHPDPQERAQIHRFIQERRDEEIVIEQQLETMFVPQHGPGQLLGARALFVSPLFQVRSKSSTRAQYVELMLGTAQDPRPIQYRGPELRQSDARVFLALVHMLRDVRAGTQACFHARDVCAAVLGRYDGDARRQLREHIHRMQRSLLLFEACSMQLVLQFDYPSSGPWTVALDPRIVQLFRVSPGVWLDLQSRLELPDGLGSWLYGYIQSQQRLIPMRLGTLIALCGSEASEKSFAESLRIALTELSRKGVIDPGWSVRGQMVHWRKCRN